MSLRLLRLRLRLIQSSLNRLQRRGQRRWWFDQRWTRMALLLIPCLLALRDRTKDCVRFTRPVYRPGVC